MGPLISIIASHVFYTRLLYTSAILAPHLLFLHKYNQAGLKRKHHFLIWEVVLIKLFCVYTTKQIHSLELKK